MVDLVVNHTGREAGGESTFWSLGYEYVSKPGYTIEYGDGIKKKGAPGGERAPGETFCGLGYSHRSESDPSLRGVEEGLWFWDPKKVNSVAEDLMGLKIASGCEYMRRVGEGVPEWVEIADRREGDWMVPCVVLEGGVVVYPKSPKCELVETMCEGEDTGMVAPPYAWSSSGSPSGFFDESGEVPEGLLKSAIHAIKIASKVNPSEKPKRKADDPAADGETSEKKPKADSAVEKKKKVKTTSTSSPSARSAEVIDLSKEDD